MRLLNFDVHRADDRDPVSKRVAGLLSNVRHVVDVGANTGQFAQRMRTEARFKGRIDSFEPSDAAYRTLSAAAAGDPDWFTHKVGLSDAPGDAVLNLHSDSSLNSLAATTAAGAGLFASIGTTQTGDTETVTLQTLDQAGLPDEGPLMLKLDTQGHDFAVLGGAAQTLERCQLLLVELSFIPLYETSVAVDEALGRIGTLGFVMVDLFPITRVGDALAEADGLFIRTG